MMPELTFGDCHTHLDQYDRDELPGLLERAGDAGVSCVILAGTTPQSTRDCLALAAQHAPLYAGVGIHPCNAFDPVDEALYAELETLARSSPKVVCISEVGLDYLPASPDHQVQDQVFRQHIRLARSLRLPVIFHSREAHPAVFRLLREEQAGDMGGAMHYFQGDEATAREAIDCGFYISLARPLTRLPELQEAVRRIPMEHIVLETDAYPQPFKKYRANWTEPRHIRSVAETLAEIKGISLEEVAQITTANLSQMLGRQLTPAGLSPATDGPAAPDS